MNRYYEEIPSIVQNYMQEINQLRGTDYDLVNYYGAEDATDVIVAMGSVTPVIEQVIDYLTTQGKSRFAKYSLISSFPSRKLFNKTAEKQ